MPWKQIKGHAFPLPTRQDILVLATSVIISLLLIAFFVLRS